MPDVNLTITVQYSKEEIIELVKKDLKTKYPNFDLKNTYFNVKDISEYGDQFTNYSFVDVDVLIVPEFVNWQTEVKLVSSTEK